VIEEVFIFEESELCDPDFPTQSPTPRPTLDEVEVICGNINFEDEESISACIDVCVGHSCCFFEGCECHSEATCERFAGPCRAVIEEVSFFEESELCDPGFEVTPSITVDPSPSVSSRFPLPSSSVDPSPSVSSAEPFPAPSFET